jgi:hypothetical protein
MDRVSVEINLTGVATLPHGDAVGQVAVHGITCSC